MNSGRIDLGLQLGSALEPFWYRRGYLKEGRDQFMRLLSHPGASSPLAARARVLSGAGRLAHLQHDLESAQRLLHESLAIWRGLEDRAGIATALYDLAGIAQHQWDVTTARLLLEESLAMRRELDDSAAMAEVMTRLAMICRLQSDLPAARALAEESLAIWRALDDRAKIVGGLASLAAAAASHYDLDTRQALYEESLGIATELGDTVGIAWALNSLGGVAHWREDYPTARARYEQSLALFRELDLKIGLLETLFHLGYTLQQQHEYSGAYAHFEEMLAISQSWGSKAIAAASLALLGAAAADLGRWEEAANRCAESLKLCGNGQRDDPHHIAWNFTVLARVAHTRALPARAARLLGAAAALLVLNTAPRWPNERADFDRIVATTRAELGDAEFAAAWAAGQALPLEQAIAEALQEAPAG